MDITEGGNHGLVSLQQQLEAIFDVRRSIFYNGFVTSVG
jgi:hypothetical protein